MSRETFDSTHRFPTRGYTHTHTHTASTRQTHTMAAAELCRSLERRKGSISLQRKKEEHVCECVTERFSWAAGSFFCRIRRDFCCFKVGFFKRFSPSFLTRILFLFLPSLSTSYLQSDFLSACVILKIQRSDLEHLLVPFFLFLL